MDIKYIKGSNVISGYNVILRLGITVHLTMIVFTVVFSVLACLVLSQERRQVPPVANPNSDAAAERRVSFIPVPVTQAMVGQDGCCDLPGKIIFIFVWLLFIYRVCNPKFYI